MLDARPNAESASERGPCVAGMTALELFPSACFLEDRANPWQEQARAWGNEVSASDGFDVLLEQPQSIPSKCSWWSGSTTYDEEGRLFFVHCRMLSTFVTQRRSSSSAGLNGSYISWAEP
jgi:hypothetical protein